MAPLYETNGKKSPPPPRLILANTTWEGVEQQTEEDLKTPKSQTKLAFKVAFKGTSSAGQCFIDYAFTTKSCTWKIIVNTAFLQQIVDLNGGGRHWSAQLSLQNGRLKGSAVEVSTDSVLFRGPADPTYMIYDLTKVQ